MSNIEITLPKPLKKTIVSRAQSENITLRDLYQRALREFIAQVEGANARGQLATFIFLARYTSPKASRLQMWLDRDLGARINRLAARAHVSRRAFCYTALRAMFPVD